MGTTIEAEVLVVVTVLVEVMDQLEVDTDPDLEVIAAQIVTLCYLLSLLLASLCVNIYLLVSVILTIAFAASSMQVIDGTAWGSRDIRERERDRRTQSQSSTRTTIIQEEINTYSVFDRLGHQSANSGTY